MRKSSLPSICLILVMGLALSWPDLVHRQLHDQREHTHDQIGHREIPSASGHSLDSESHHGAHPHLDITATPPTKAALHPSLLVAEHLVSMDPPMDVVRVSEDTSNTNRPRSPPAGPQPAIRAPPSA